MKRQWLWVAVWMAMGTCLHAAETVRLKATADIWLSDCGDERNTSAGKCGQFKLKSIQEMAAIRFDAAVARGREVLKATLFLRRAGADMLRYIRVSTVNQDWAEGSSAQPYGPANGATYCLADAATKKPWAWPGSMFCDVIMSSGYTLDTWAERKELADGWVSVALTPELVYALACGDTDGLAVMDGGNLAYHNNMIHSAQSKGSEPYIEVELGKALTEAPATLAVKAWPAPEKAHLNAGALKLTIAEAKGVLCWRITLNGKPVERWRVKHPEPNGPTTMYLEDLPPSEKCEIEVVAVAPGGAVSPAAKLTVIASPALPAAPTLAKLEAPVSPPLGPRPKARMYAWAAPPLVKISPEKPEAMFGDMASRDANAVWDGKCVKLFGARGETVSYQICIESGAAEPLAHVQIIPQELKSREGKIIGGKMIEVFKNWYAKNGKGQWQPAYCVPLPTGAPFNIPDVVGGASAPRVPNQQNQTVTVDIFIPKDASPGAYAGGVLVEADGVEPPIKLPIELTVFDFILPDRLSFVPELNAYRIPPNAHDFYRLAHEHRCVANLWVHRPRLKGAGKDIQVDWDSYDRAVGPLVSGEAFENCRRPAAPVEALYLPFDDSWPTPLSKKTYNYPGHWPGRGEDKKFINEHYLKAPYIGDALSQDYKDAFLAVQRQFIEHFKERGWDKTELQCFYGGKNTHRIDWGVNMWWTTDEPYHWDDWLALQFFCQLWTKGRGDAPRSLWASRGDISRPMWQGRVMDGILGCEYIGGFNDANAYRRCRILADDTGVDIRAYGGANRDTESNTASVVMLLSMWANGANAHLPWQTLGSEAALDTNDKGAGGGNALLVPGKRFNQPAVADIRLKAFREGQQLIEYLVELGRRYGLNREQLKAMVHAAAAIQTSRVAGAGADNADALVFSGLKAWQIAGLRRAVAELIVKKR
ncbi:MAG TPA: hypothetical protein VNE39_02660 [Planctomycetota bacterium]|nr:hypothetical protein [Planctomycetota bacterium]